MKKVICLFLSILLFGCTSTSKDPVKEEPKTPKVQADTRVSLLAVGDNLIHNSIYLDKRAKQGDLWNYDYIYEKTNYMTQKADIVNITQETILGGRELGLESYPSFNSPQEIGDSLVKSGFNWISQAGNHSFDMGEVGIQAVMKFWDKFPEVKTTGLNRSQEEADSFRILEKKGIKFGLLNYAYGLNGYVVPEGKGYLVNVIDRDKITKDVTALKEKCDVILVSMHWGEEYTFQPTNEQKELAQLLADLGVSVVIGSHPHVIEPIEFITGKDGNKTLVAYSLGNFISAQDVNYRMLGGMMKCDVVKDGKTGKFRVENTEFLPTITQFEPGMVNFSTYLLKDYTDELASKHMLAFSISRKYFIDLANEVLGKPENVKVIY